MNKPAVISRSAFKRMQTWKAQHPNAPERYVAYHQPYERHPCHVVRIRRLKPGRNLPTTFVVCEMPERLHQHDIHVDGTRTELGWA